MSDFCKYCGDFVRLGSVACNGCLAVKLRERELRAKSDFCHHCGASIPPRDGEGTCERCEPKKTRLMGLWQAYAQHKRSCNVVQQPRIYVHCNCGLPADSLEFGALVRKLREK